jgi:uroporphyrinogen-III synthase
LNGARVGILEGRMGAELSELIRRHGGVPRLAPAVREKTLAEVQGFEQLMGAFGREAVDVVLFLTGVGATALFDEAERAGRLPDLLARLQRTTNVCRGQKPWKPLKERGVPISVTVPEPYTTADVISTMAKLRVETRGVALLHYGERNEELSRTLTGWGARVIELFLYEWQLPEDTGPVIELVEEVIGGEVDVIAFTSQVQVRHLLEIADGEGRADALLSALRSRVVVAAVGPTCAAALHACEVVPNVVPEHPKMGPMVVAVAEHLAAGRAIPRRQRASVAHSNGASVSSGPEPKPGVGRSKRSEVDAPESSATRSLSELVGSYERSLIEEALKSTGGNQARAATLLRTTERILGYRIKRYGIDPRGFSNAGQ